MASSRELHRAVDVCDACFRTNPHDEKLMEDYCRKGLQHLAIDAPKRLVTWSTNKFVLVAIRPLPNPPRERYTLCKYHREGNCTRGLRCTYAHSQEEMDAWNTQLDRSMRHQQAAVQRSSTQQQPWTMTMRTATPTKEVPVSLIPAGYKTQVSYSRSTSYQRRFEATVEHAKARLVQNNYQSKFYSLLHYEEEEHAKLLSDRCNGEYQLSIYKIIPSWMKKGRGDISSRYGCLSGMTGDQIMYASQASECLFIVDQSGVNLCSAKMLQENFHNHYDDLLIEFEDEEARKLEAQLDLTNKVICQVEFKLKYFYFNSLRKSLNRLSNDQICKVMPNPAQRDHGPLQVLPHLSPCNFIELDAESQQPALQKIVSCKPQVPVLLSGAFGTGKTRLLAVATYHFIEEGKQKKVPTRVLIACHHQKTADTFIEEYFGKMVQNKVNPWRVKIARITRAHYNIQSNYYDMYKNLDRFRNMFSLEFSQEDYVVIITTFLTGLNFKYTVGENFFTHILLDEAAQAREPEAVAPLCMANENTKIVIAGDDRQVGPEILVLGDIAHDNGLAKSLFTRLLEFYNQYRLPVAKLHTNYRCHEEIVDLARTLFYSQSLQPRAELTAIPGVVHPIWFVCSSLEKKTEVDVETDSNEAGNLVQQLKLFFEDPNQLEDVYIIANNRNQLSNIKRDLKKPITSHLVPTYMIQGREFEAVFVSTVEALDPSGCSLNPTKSLCSPSVFNTVITRAKSLVVAIGNPYILMLTEEKMNTGKQCWAHYLHKCFKTGTVVAGEEIKSESLQELQRFVDQKLHVVDQERQENKILSNSTPRENEPETASLGPVGLENKNLMERHIKEQGSMNLLSLKSFFIGPTCVGKTTARRRLTYEITHILPGEIIPSTVFDPPLTVQIHHRTDQVSVLLPKQSEQEWKILGLEDQCYVLCSHAISTAMLPRDNTPSLPPTASPITISPTTALACVSEDKTKPSVKRKRKKKKRSRVRHATVIEAIESQVSTKELSSDTSTHDETDDPIANPTEDPADDKTNIMTELLKLVKTKDWASIRKIIKDKYDLTFLHIIDIGGQPECHEILPLLLHGLAFNLIFLNVTQDMDSPYKVVYRDDHGCSSVQYESEFTIREVIQRALCSIASLQTSQPAAILVGTYLDQSSEAAVLNLDRSIQVAFKESDFMKKDILYQVNKSGEKERYIHPLNNVSSDPSDIDELRRIITTIVHQRFRPEPVPTSTLLFHLILRQRFEVRGWCSLEECVDVANICHISKNDLLGENGILQFLHDRFGTILYYRDLKIGQRVIINTNVILAPTTELFVHAFGAKESKPNTAKRIRTTGEISQQIMDEACSFDKADDDKIPTSEIVELLASRYILYENVRSANEETTYFLPSLLYPDHDVGKESSDPVRLSSLFYSPILLCPQTEFCPLGLFPATIVKLSQKESWKLDECERFRNRIRFYVLYSGEKQLHVELRTLSTHLEFRIVSTPPVNPRLIPVVRKELWDAVIKVSKLYQHTQAIKWWYGFYCPHSVSSGGQPHPLRCRSTEEPPQDVVCSQSDCHGGLLPLEDRHKCWFMVLNIDADCHKDVMLKGPDKKLMSEGPIQDSDREDKPSPKGSSLTVNELMKMCSSVTDWHALGLQLKLTMNQLKSIEVTYSVHGVKRIKAEMFDVWLKNSPSASLADFIKALKSMGEVSAARNIEASCYPGNSLEVTDCNVVMTDSESLKAATQEILELKNQQENLQAELKTAEYEIKKLKEKLKTATSKYESTKKTTQLWTVDESLVPVVHNPVSSQKHTKHDVAIQTSYLDIAPELQGVDLCGETVFEVLADSLPQKLVWHGYGFNIEVPDGALPPGATASVIIRLILRGYFSFPKNSKLVSAIFWISSSKKFLKQVAVNIQHCAHISNEVEAKKFKFIIAKCSQSPPYTFVERDGVFSAETQYATIHCKKFLFFGLIGYGKVTKQYTALKFYNPVKNSLSDANFRFVVLSDLKATITKYNAEMVGWNPDVDNSTHPIKFKDDSISLDIQTHPPLEVDNWRIIPRSTPLKIKKADVDRYEVETSTDAETADEHVAPSCNILLQWIGPEDKSLVHRVTISGTTEPDSSFTISYYQSLDSTKNRQKTKKQLGLKPHSPKPTVKVLSRELKGITDWKELGIQLSLEPSKLDEIELNNHNVANRRSSMLNQWLKSNSKAAWEDVVLALRAIDENCLATRIEEKYCGRRQDTTPADQQIARSSIIEQDSRFRSQSTASTTVHQQNGEAAKSTSQYAARRNIMSSQWIYYCLLLLPVVLITVILLVFTVK